MRDYDDEHTMVDGRRTPPTTPVATAPARPRKLPAFVPAETVVPVVSYRSAAGPDLGKALASLEQSVMEKLPATQRAHASPLPAPLPQRRGELTVVFGCRGGAGSTTLAINTAAQLQRAGKSVCLVDLDLHLGDVLVALDLEAQTSLAAVAREAHALDAVSLRRRLAAHPSGLSVLAQAGQLDDLDAQLPARLPALLDTLRAHFDHVVVDGIRDFGDVALPALEVATRVLVVVAQDVPSVRRAARVLGVLRRLGLDDNRLRLIVNRAVRGAAIDDASIERALGARLAARVRDDDRAARALHDGVLLVDIAHKKTLADLASVAALLGGK